MNKKRKIQNRLAAGAMFAGVATVGCLHAGATPFVANVPLQNASFESPGAGSAVADWTVTTAGNPALAADLINSYGASGGTMTGVYNLEISTQYNGGNPITVSQQTAAKAYFAGQTITLTVATGDHQYDPSVQTGPLDINNIAITINGVVVAENTADPGYQNFGTKSNDPNFRTYVDITASYTLTEADILADPSLLGGTIGVELLTPTTTAAYFYDNVRLTTTTPEPSTWALVLAGLLSLVGWRRMRRSS